MDLSSMPEKFRDLAKRRLEAGTLSSPDDIVAEALRLWAEQESFIDEHAREIRAQIAEGVSSAESGRLRDGEEAIRAVRRRIDSRLSSE